MSDASDRAAALIELQALVPINDIPCITENELEQCLDSSKLATTWITNTLLEEGIVIKPATPNGRWYVVRKPGTTGATEPIWPTPPSSALHYINWDFLGTITDNTVIYEDYGEAFTTIFDVQVAAMKGWQKKLTKAVGYFNTPGVSMSQIFDHCEKMIERFEPVLISR